MADKNVDVSITANADGTYTWVIDDPIDMGKGKKDLVFKAAGTNKSEWDFQNISIWLSTGTDPDQPGNVVKPPWGTPEISDNKITIEDDDTQAATYEYRLYAKYGNASISHDPQIINRGA